MTDSVDIEPEDAASTPDEYWVPTPQEEAQSRDEAARYFDRTPEAVAHQAVDDWNNTHLYQADSWFIIPEFGVRPADVEFKGFDGTIFNASNPQKAECVRELVKTARVLAMRHFPTLRELNTVYDQWVGRREVDRSDEREVAAWLYRHVMFMLQRDFHKGQIPDHLLSTASLIASWGARGAQAAFEERERGRKQRRDAARGKRPGALSSIRDRILEQMKPYRVRGVAFKQFLEGWQLGPVGGLHLQNLGDKYRVTDWDSISHQPGDDEREYTFTTLVKMYSESLTWAPRK